MRIRRREFIELLGASIASISTPAFDYSDSWPDHAGIVEEKGWRLSVTPVGEIVSFRSEKLELVNRRLGDSRPRLLIGGRKLYVCERPTVLRRQGNKLIFRYDFSGRDTFAVHYELELRDLPQAEVSLQQKVGIQCPTRLSEDVKLLLPRNIQLPYENRKVFLPLKNGVGRQKPVQGYESNDEYVYSFAGGYDGVGKPQLLAIPMLDEYADQTDLHVTLCSDPYFSSYFFLPYQERIGQFHCVYSGRVGLQGTEERTVYTVLHRGNGRGAMQSFYATSLADVKPGPDWLHDVAMVGFDYLSKNGQGWYADIDTLTKVVAPDDRSKVFLALHGWYDYLGRYTFDARTRSLEKEWMAFPRALDPDIQALADVPETRTGPVCWWNKSSVERMRPVPMSISEVRRRIRYAKDRGFRVGIYYSDGTAACEGVKDTFDPDKVLRWGGWVGPDTKGRTYAQNPLHPEVRRFYIGYMRALLEEYGKEVDGFIWDETFIVGPHELGPELYPGYASRAMMTLVKEIAAMVMDFNPQLALFASDDIGAFPSPDDASPYCLVAHGTYQDSWCAPVAWPYGLFPNYRNVLWSCNWAPVTRFEFTRYGVETFGVPVAISNGPFGDDIGVSEMNPGYLGKTVDLFNKRKQKRMEISWIEENASNPTYQAKEVGFKWNL